MLKDDGIGACWNMKKKKKKKNRSNFYWRVVKVCVGSIQYRDIGTFCFLRSWNIFNSKFLKILNYIKSLCMIFMLNRFKYFDQKFRKFFVQKCFNTLRRICVWKNMSQGKKCFNAPIYSYSHPLYLYNTRCQLKTIHS